MLNYQYQLNFSTFFLSHDQTIVRIIDNAQLAMLSAIRTP